MLLKGIGREDPKFSSEFTEYLFSKQPNAHE